MDNPRILTNNIRFNSLLRAKLRILARTNKIRGVEVAIWKSSNDVFAKVHGYNNIDLSGDRADENHVIHTRFVLNLNNLEHVGEKNSSNQTVYSTEDCMDEGDIVVYTSRLYEYAFRCSKKNTYGEEDFLYEYELEHFRTIKIGKNEKRELTFYDKRIDRYFKDHNSDQEGAVIVSDKPDWTQRIDILNKI